MDSTGVSVQHLHTSDRCIPSSQHTAAQPLLKTTGNLLEKEKSGRSKCECVCAFVSLRACLLASPRQLGARRRGGQKGQNLAFLSLSMLLSLSLSFTDCHQEYKKHSQGFPAIQNKIQDPPFPYHSPLRHVKVGTVQQLSASADVHFPGQGRKKAPEPS